MATETVVAIARLPVEDGVDDNGSVKVHYFEPGDEVKGHGVTKEMLETWKASGSVGDSPALLPSVVAEKEALEERVKVLEAQLAAAQDAKDEENKPQAQVKTTPKV